MAGRILIDDQGRVLIGADGRVREESCAEECCGPPSPPPPPPPVCQMIVRALPCFPLQKGCQTHIGPVWLCADALCGDGTPIAGPLGPGGIPAGPGAVVMLAGQNCYGVDHTTIRPRAELPPGEKLLEFDPKGRFECLALGCADPRCNRPDQCICLCYSTVQLPDGRQVMGCCMGETDSQGNPLWDFDYVQTELMTLVLTPHNGGEPAIPGCFPGTGPSSCIILDRTTRTLPGNEHRFVNEGPCCVRRRTEVETRRQVQLVGGIIGCHENSPPPETVGPLDGVRLCPPVPGPTSAGADFVVERTDAPVGPCTGGLRRRVRVEENSCTRYVREEIEESRSFQTSIHIIGGVATIVCTCESLLTRTIRTVINYHRAPAVQGACEGCAAQLDPGFVGQVAETEGGGPVGFGVGGLAGGQDPRIIGLTWELQFGCRGCG